jgi:isoamylase
MARTVLPGKPYPLGATWDGHGVNFALFSEAASGVELCLFASAASPVPSETIALHEVTAHVWHA